MKSLAPSAAAAFAVVALAAFAVLPARPASSRSATQGERRPPVSTGDREARSRRMERSSAALEEQLLGIVNRERAHRGLPALTPDPILTEAARGHSREMCRKDYFAHYSPTPGLKTPTDRYLQVAGTDAPAAAIGENIYFADTVSVPGAHRAFMNSPGHRENVLDRGWRRIGIGIHCTPRGQFWVTEMFSD